MNDLQVFNYEGASVRVIDRDGEPWFVGKDVAEILGYSNNRKAIGDHVDEEDKGVTKRDTLGGVQELVIINESGLYSLILSSRLPGARQFKRWVTSEVLPSIRKHGIYATPITIDRILNDPDLGIRLFTQLKEEREKRAALETTVAVQTQQIAEMNPKATYYDTVLQCKDLVTITRIAKDFRLSAQALNRILAEKKVQFKQGDMWVLYQKYAEKQDKLTFDTAPVSGSSRPVASGGIHTALQQKQDALTFDASPTEGSTNPVTSGGVYAAIRDGHGEVIFDDEPVAGSRNAVKSGGIYTALQRKQDALSFDSAPVSGSENPVRSGGLYAALAGKQDDLTRVPTVSSLRETDYLFLERNGTIYKIRASAVIIPSGGGDGIETESGDALLTEDGQEILLDTGDEEPGAVLTQSGERLLAENSEPIIIDD